MSDFWSNPERVELLRQYWEAGMSCSQISRAFGGEISRCGVMGKVHRLHLPARVTISARRYHQAKPPAPKPVTVKELPPPPVDEPEFLCPPGTFPDSFSACRYPRGETNGMSWQMCGHPVVKPGISYCPYHAARCYEPARTEASRKKGENAEAYAAVEDAAMRRVGLG